jgi:hypothetical protein
MVLMTIAKTFIAPHFRGVVSRTEIQHLCRSERLLGYQEPAATISGFAAAARFVGNHYPELDAAIAHLREALGDETYELFSRAGQSMTNAGMATYAIEPLDRARADLVQAG